MAQSFSRAFYDSTAWRKCRKSFIAERIAIDGGMCQECGTELGYIVHHKERLTSENISNPDVTLNHSMLEYVCHVCHNRIECGEDYILFDEDGQPIPP